MTDNVGERGTKTVMEVVEIGQSLNHSLPVVQGWGIELLGKI